MTSSFYNTTNENIYGFRAWTKDRFSIINGCGGYPIFLFNIAILKLVFIDSFTFEVDLIQTGRENGHRDVRLFFGFKDAIDLTTLILLQ